MGNKVMSCFFAFCDSSGRIDFDDFVPVCMFELASGSAEAVKEIVGDTAASRYQKLFVPGMREAKSLADKIGAKNKYCELLSAFNSFYFTAKVPNPFNHTIYSLVNSLEKGDTK